MGLHESMKQLSRDIEELTQNQSLMQDAAYVSRVAHAILEISNSTSDDELGGIVSHIISQQIKTDVGLISLLEGAKEESEGKPQKIKQVIHSLAIHSEASKSLARELKLLAA